MENKDSNLDIIMMAYHEVTEQYEQNNKHYVIWDDKKLRISKTTDGNIIITVTNENMVIYSIGKFLELYNGHIRLWKDNTIVLDICNID